MEPSHTAAVQPPRHAALSRDSRPCACRVAIGGEARRRAVARPGGQRGPAQNQGGASIAAAACRVSIRRGQPGRRGTTLTTVGDRNRPFAHLRLRLSSAAVS